MEYYYLDCEDFLKVYGMKLDDLHCEHCGVDWVYLGEYSLGYKLVNSIYSKYSYDFYKDNCNTNEELLYYFVSELDYTQRKIDEQEIY